MGLHTLMIIIDYNLKLKRIKGVTKAQQNAGSVRSGPQSHETDQRISQRSRFTPIGLFEEALPQPCNSNIKKVVFFP